MGALDLFASASAAISNTVNDISQKGPGGALAELEEVAENSVIAWGNNVGTQFQTEANTPAPSVPQAVVNRQTALQGYINQFNNFLHSPAIKDKAPYILGVGAVAILMTATLAKSLRYVGYAMGSAALYLYIKNQPKSAPAAKA